MSDAVQEKRIKVSREGELAALAEPHMKDKMPSLQVLQQGTSRLPVSTQGCNMAAKLRRGRRELGTGRRGCSAPHQGFTSEIHGSLESRQLPEVTGGRSAFLPLFENWNLQLEPLPIFWGLCKML